ncbi:hypothetical protein ABKN59_010138 [Abortiporus biennis]
MIPEEFTSQWLVLSFFFLFLSKKHSLAHPCKKDGSFLPENTPPPLLDLSQDWMSFGSRSAFEFTSLVYKKVEMSAGDVSQLLCILKAYNLKVYSHDEEAIFESFDKVLTSINEITVGDVNYTSFFLCYNVYTRNTIQVVTNILSNEEFNGAFDYAWKKAEEIAEDPDTHGAMLCPIILGVDKMTVSNATGHTEFHPVYMSIGNLHNDMRHTHKESVIPITFLSISKTCREHEDEQEFQTFRKQLYHASLAKILAPLRNEMLKPIILQYPDQHFHCIVFEIGLFIADYPEQVLVSGIVQGWCPKCLCLLGVLDGYRQPHFRELDELLMDWFSLEDLWDVFGITADVLPFTSAFSCTDIHEIITSDLFHQLIKGTFKDHLVSWVEEYLVIREGSTAVAKKILDDIDHCIAAVPRNDSKALIKVYIPTITGHVPDKMVKCFVTFMDFYYLVCHPSHDNHSLEKMKNALQCFHTHHTIFKTTGVHPNGFSLPRQHSLCHYVDDIRLFGSPNSLCIFIMESKHIVAVKKLWCCSSQFKALGQILRTNTRLSKLAAACTIFGKKGMLKHDVLTVARIQHGLKLEDSSSDEGADNKRVNSDEVDIEEVDGL